MKPQATKDLPHPFFSRFYAKVSARMEDEGLADLRRELLAGLEGEVVEVGAGNGMNFAHYPPTVTRVIAVEPEPYLRGLAEQAARKAPVPVTVVAGTAARLPLEDHSVDAAVLCLVLCSIRDRRGALAELLRVLCADGHLRFLEHTIAETPSLRRLQRIVDATVWPPLTGGCHTATDPMGDIAEAGFSITQQRRLRFPERGLTVPASPHVMGTAIAPTANRDGSDGPP
jgi:ubiquinone/menaquinone biosynthesis C-methylase UbiE